MSKTDIAAEVSNIPVDTISSEAVVHMVYTICVFKRVSYQSFFIRRNHCRDQRPLKCVKMPFQACSFETCRGLQMQLNPSPMNLKRPTNISCHRPNSTRAEKRNERKQAEVTND